jgi:transcriptional regulator with XRE-family HTH domain
MAEAGEERRYFADVLRGAMAECRLTQPQLAAAVEVSQARVSRWLSRRGLPSDENVERLASALGRSPKSLMRYVVADRKVIFGELDKRSASERLSEIETRLARVERLLDQLVKMTRTAQGNGEGSPRKPRVR